MSIKGRSRPSGLGGLAAVRLSELQSFDAVRAQQLFICVEWCRLPEQTVPAGSRSTWLSGARVERRLAAISAADPTGCSRLMGQDDTGTLARFAGRAHAMCNVSDELDAARKRSSWQHF
jgi:hypothetical protein